MSMSGSMTRKMSKVVEENPFYKMASTLDLFQQCNKLSDDAVTQQQVYNYLSAAWKECDSKVKKELFFVLVFSLGDVTNREHNLFRKMGIKTPDKGGQGKRRVFLFCLKWMVEKVPVQFYSFLPIIGEYCNKGAVMYYQLRTDRWKGQLKEVIHVPISVHHVTDYITKVLKSQIVTDNERTLWARWLPHVPSGSRTRRYTITDKNLKVFKKNEHFADVKVGDIVKQKKAKKDHTKDKDAWVITLIKALSEKMDWKIESGNGNMNFVGYRQFRKTYLADTEATKFSAHPDDPRSIVHFDKTQFFEWLDKQPSSARYRVACRIVSKDKAGNLSPRDKWKLNSGENCGTLYMQWLDNKSKAQEKLASLTTEEKEKLAPKELQQMQKAAKVNIGGDTLLDLVADLASKNLNVQEMDTKAFSMLELINIGVPVLICSDISGSMASGGITHKKASFTANALCQLATTIFLLKNPDPDAGEFFMRFGTTADVVISGKAFEGYDLTNRFMTRVQVRADKLIDKAKPFSWNLANISQFIPGYQGGTDLSLIPKELKRWVDEVEAFKGQRIDMINRYPVILVISDGDLNSSGSAGKSFLEFQQNMRQWFGWEGVTVFWDVKQASSGDGGKFSGINNIMYFGGMNMGILDQIFRNINDLDVIDPYLPLKALHSSNRYTPVKELVL